MASGFAVAICACLGSRPTAGLAEKSFDLGWLTWAGPPVSVVLDRGSTFMGDLDVLRNDLSLVMNYAAPEAHWQMGKVEREIRCLEETGTSVFNAGSSRGSEAVAAAVRSMATACNQLVTNAGFSPRQRVTGAGRRLPAPSES